MSVKIKMKIGAMEIEFEGTEEFLRKDVPSLVEKMVSACNDPGMAINGGTPGNDGSQGQTPPPNSNVFRGTVGTIAGKLSVNSGAELIIAAAAALSISQSKEEFTRKQLLDEMQKAKTYYSRNYSRNLSRYLKALVKGPQSKLRETAADTYALEAKTKVDLEEKLAG